MKKTAILTIAISLFIVTNCLNGYADDLSANISVLEQKADRIQSQITQAKQQSSAQTDGQVKSLQATIDGLVNQRVQLDAHIARLEAQMEDVKKSSQVNLDRQLKQYAVELNIVKQEISGMVAKKNTTQAQKLDEAPKANLAPAGGPAPTGN